MTPPLPPVIREHPQDRLSPGAVALHGEGRKTLPRPRSGPVLGAEGHRPGFATRQPRGPACVGLCLPHASVASPWESAGRACEGLWEDREETASPDNRGTLQPYPTGAILSAPEGFYGFT